MEGRDRQDRTGRCNGVSRLLRKAPHFAIGSVLLLVALSALRLDPQQTPKQRVSSSSFSVLPNAKAQATGAEKETESAQGEKRRQMVEDSAKLLELATQLKTAVDKTDKDTLSIQVVRKASEIEKLAHDVRNKMRLAAGQD